MEISLNGTRLTIIPSWYDQKFSLKSARAYEVPQGASLLICRHMKYGYFGGDEILLRASDGSETSIYASPQGLPRSIGDEIKNALASRPQIAVKSIMRALSAEGSEDSEWVAKKYRLDPQMAAAAILNLLFPISGALIRLSTANPATISIFGLVYWLLLVLYWRYLFRRRDASKTLTAARIGMMLFHNALFYVFAVLLTDAAMRN